MVAFCYGAISLCESIYVDGHEVEIGHLLEEMCCWWRSSDCNAYRVRKFFSFLRGTQEGVDRWRCVEMRDVLVFEKLPD